MTVADVMHREGRTIDSVGVAQDGLSTHKGPAFAEYLGTHTEFLAGHGLDRV